MAARQGSTEDGNGALYPHEQEHAGARVRLRPRRARGDAHRYWINDEADPKSWADVNFFDNDFSDGPGFFTLGQESGGSSPDAPGYGSVNLSSPASAAA